DIDMADMVYQDYLEKLVVERVIPEQVLNDSVKRVLLLKYNLGLFDNPYTDNTREEHELYSAYALKLAKICAEKSIVLLKNKNNALPLPIKSKALIVGSLAKDKTAMHGSWAYYDDVTRTIDLVDGLNKVYNIDYLPCFNKDSIFEEDLTLAINNIDKYDRVFLVAGEDINMAGEAASRSSLELSDIEKEVIVQFSYRTNKLTLLLINGRPLALQSVEQYFDSIVECWNLGTMAGEAVAEVLVGRVNPQGKLTMSFPRVTGQCPLYYNHENTGRPYGTDKYTSKYIDVADGALYPFGYGLTYSDITISDCAIEELTDKSVTVSMIMRNDSDVDCIETAQLYASPVYSCPVAPVMQLVGFVKEQINARSSAVVTITVDKDTIFHYTQPTNIICHDYVLYIGLSSNDTLSLQVTL
ncbi:MAG: glycoside hydrolase family 3 C-terminal domain-containing protein, partial [Clostridia bacterium]